VGLGSPSTGNGGPEFNQVKISAQHHNGEILTRRSGRYSRLMLVSSVLLALGGCNMIGGAFSSVGSAVLPAGNSQSSGAAQAAEQRPTATETQAPLGTGTSDQQIERLEQEVTSLRAELAQLKPSIERLVGIEGDIRVLLTQLSRLTDPGAPQAETTGATTPPDNTEEAVQPATANPIEDDIRVLLTQLLRLTEPGATTPPDNTGEAVQRAAANPPALRPVEEGQPAASPGQPQSLRPLQLVQAQAAAVLAAPTQLTSISPSVAPAEQISVHLASFREQDKARQGWRELQGTYSDLLGGLDYRISAVQLSGGRGTFYRVKAGPFTDTSSAEEICGLMKSRNAYCVLSDFNGSK
jgi:hypothetical protein